MSAIVRFFLDNTLLVGLLLLLFIGWGLVVAPFDFGVSQLPRDPVPVDAIPDIGENQQIVFTQWPGQSPQDVEDQVTYPLTTALLGVPGVKSVRSNSMFGFSSIYLIFEEEVDFYFSRSRILERLNSLPPGLLPDGAAPALGPDATALGQIFWYTLEGRDAEGNPAGGWDLHELRSIQDYYVRYGLQAANGVAEVASVGGHVKEYQVDADPDQLLAYNISLQQLLQALQNSNRDVGARTLEINLAEYFVRGLGYLESLEDIEETVIVERNNVPVTVGDVARVNIGPAARRGLLDKSGAEAVGGVAIARYGANPLAVIDNVKAKIAELAPGLPVRELEDGRISQVTIVPFYDRTELIQETLGTLEEALTLEILITALVVLLLLLNWRAAFLVAGTLPVAVLVCFILMRYFKVDANVVALAGIAIAIGTMVDMGIVLVESMVLRLRQFPDLTKKENIYTATMEVAPAVLTSVATTIVSFLPVFTMEAAEGKLFRPLAFTKTFALLAAIFLAITVLPTLARYLLRSVAKKKEKAQWLSWARYGTVILLAALLTYFLTEYWMPLGVEQSLLFNLLFVGLAVGLLVGSSYLLIHFYAAILGFLLRVKWLFLLLIGALLFLGYRSYQNLGQEFLPALDEGAFLLMPTSMPHAGIQENLRNLRLLDMAVTAIPEVETVVGKAGRADTPLDPAPLSMYENVIRYKSEYRTDADGRRLRYRVDDAGNYVLNETGEPIPDPDGQYYRQWRDHIQSPDDIWQEIVRVAQLPGVTSAPKLQPIETRLVMLQTGMRAPMGIKVRGDDLATLEDFGLQLAELLKEVDGVKEAAVFADRVVGKPYLLLDLKRDALARYGLSVARVQRHIQVAIGGMAATSTVEGRERYAVRLRYPRELREDPTALADIEIPTRSGQVRLGELVDIRYEQGPQNIKSEDGFLVSYVLFDKEAGVAETDLIDRVRARFDAAVDDGALAIPAGVSYRFAGNYEQQLRANARLALVVPIALGLIFLILYFQFRSILVALFVFSGVFVAFAGGFMLLELYGNVGFLDIDFLGENLRDVLNVTPINMSVAVWVGFLALFGIATDDGVLVATFIQQSFKKRQPETVAEVRAAVLAGGLRRVRPAMMTTVTTLLALLPVLTSTGRGADLLLPMALPTFGGMLLQVITLFTVPVLYALWQEGRIHWRSRFPKTHTDA